MAQSFTDLETVSALVAYSDIIISVCPPHAALELAGNVASLGFRGIFVDANAISPATARAIKEVIETAGAAFVDGGIIGPPAYKSGTTRLYLSGTKASEITRLFAGTVLQAIPLDNRSDSASAVKMCYAAYTKGHAALLIAIRALAKAQGVDKALLDEWSLSQPGLGARSEQAARGSASKAWRWIAEMHEIAASFQAVGLPEEFHRGAAKLYEAIACYKDREPAPDLTEILETLLQGNHIGEFSLRKR